jgi:hypothetical protein
LDRSGLLLDLANLATKSDLASLPPNLGLMWGMREKWLTK